MKKSFYLWGTVCSIVITVSFIALSCTNKLQEEFGMDSKSEEILKTYANIHNLGLDQIKQDMEKTTEDYTTSQLDSAFEKWSESQYGKQKSHSILKSILPMKNLVLDGIFPTTKNSRSNQDVYAEKANNLAQEALDECTSKITNHLNLSSEDEIFDNKSLLSDLHNIIKETHLSYTKKCNSDVDRKSLDETMGVLYGSIEYWSNSSNVAYWSKKNSNSETEGRSTRAPQKKPVKNDRTLKKHEYLVTMATIDAGGAAIGTPAFAVICSAAAALYFDPE